MSRHSVRADERLAVDGFRMYPDSSGIIRLRRPKGRRPVVNIYLTPAEARKLAARLADLKEK